MSEFAPERIARPSARHSPDSSKPIARSGLHTIVLLLSGTCSITTSALVGPSIFPCQRDKRITWIRILETMTRTCLSVCHRMWTSLNFCKAKSYQSLPSSQSPNSEPSPLPTIVLIVVQIYALSTVAFHRCRPRDRWKNIIMVLVLVLGIILNPPSIWNTNTIFKQAVVLVPQMMSFGLFSSVLVHYRTFMRETTRNYRCLETRNLITNHGNIMRSV